MTTARNTAKVGEVAAYYRVRPHTVLAWIASGELEAENIATSRATRPLWRISPDALERFAATRRNRPEPKVVRKTRTTRTERIKQFFKP